MSITIAIKKGTVYNEVAQLTAYTGAKTNEETGNAYDRVFTTDDDRSMLERFWREACAFVTDGSKIFVTSVSSPANRDTVDLTEVFTLTLTMPSNYDTNLTTSIQEAIYSYFVNSIASKWFLIAKRDDAAVYESQAIANWTDARSKLFFRKKPSRTIPSV